MTRSRSAVSSREKSMETYDRAPAGIMASPPDSVATGRGAESSTLEDDEGRIAATRAVAWSGRQRRRQLPP